MDIHEKLETIEDLLRRALYETEKVMLRTKGSVLHTNIREMHEALQDALQFQQFAEDSLHTLEYERE